MTRPQVASAAPPDPPSDVEPGLETQSRTTVLVTEQEVIVGTAAAVPMRPSTIRRWSQMTYVVAAAWQRIFLTTADARPARRYQPARYQFLESALMSREMDRL